MATSGPRGSASSSPEERARARPEWGAGQYGGLGGWQGSGGLGAHVELGDAGGAGELGCVCQRGGFGGAARAPAPRSTRRSTANPPWSWLRARSLPAAQRISLRGVGALGAPGPLALSAVLRGSLRFRSLFPGSAERRSPALGARMGRAQPVFGARSPALGVRLGARSAARGCGWRRARRLSGRTGRLPGALRAAARGGGSGRAPAPEGPA